MQHNSTSQSVSLSQLWKVMRLSIFLLCIPFIQVSANIYAQKTKMSLHLDNVKIQYLFRVIQQETEFDFIFKSSLFKNRDRVSVHFDDATIYDILNQVIPGDLEYEISDRTIVIRKAKVKPTYSKENKVRGKITDSKGEAIPGVSIRIKGTNLGSVTDIDGNYFITVPDRYTTLIYSSIGFMIQEVDISGRTTINVVLEEDIEALEEVIVTGYFIAEKDSYTGTATTIQSEDIINMGGANLLDNLALAAPSLQIVQNNALGSNPNAIPEIRIRGESVLNTNSSTNLSANNLLGDPNLPLFILDNFQVDIQRVLDLDQTRVESVSILRDASATAIYGSRAANGVIVIKTKQPEIGQLQVTYSLFTDVDIADVNSYNLLSGQELFEVQKRLGMRNPYSTSWYAGNETREIERLLAAGVETDWLAQPVRNSIGQRHSINIQGGNEEIRYGVDMYYNHLPGVMKESQRVNYGAAMSLTYSPTDQLTFRNRLEVNFNNAHESPYGSFSYYARMPGYLPLRNLDGTFTQLYEYDGFGEVGYFGFQSGGSGRPPIYNPLYEAEVGNLDQSSYTNLINNFEIIWNISDLFRLQSNVSYTQQDDVREVFASPFSQSQLAFDPLTRGTYDYSTTETRRIDGSATLNFSQDFSGHFVSANLGANIQESIANLYAFQTWGYTSTNPDPTFSNGFSSMLPQSVEQKSRLAGIFMTANYTYKSRYLVDGSYRLDGSSAFGANDRFAPFYSVGVGWNLHNEAFISGSKIINSLRLRATYGQTGSVSFSSYQALTTLEYYTNDRYVDFLGTTMLGIGNDDLRWQTTENREAGIDFVLWKSRISGQVAYYLNTTKDLVTDVDAPPSLGFSSFTENLGLMQNKGFELSLSVDVVRNSELSIRLFGSGFQNKNKILEIGNALESFNTEAERLGLDPAQYQEALDNGGKITVTNEDGSTNSLNVNLATISQDFLVRYEEGGSQNDIWAVQSLGIDPMSGQEYFLNSDGEATLFWNTKDQVVVGNTEPDLRGTFGSNIGYKGFNLNLTFAYEFGGQIYNQTLVDKVENSDKYGNVDRRILTEGWFEMGDVVPFKSNVNIDGDFITQNVTYASSRFVQDFSYVSLSSANLTYDVPVRLIDRLKMRSMRLSFNMNDVFYVSPIRQERGTQFPFARSFTLGLRMGF